MTERQRLGQDGAAAWLTRSARARARWKKGPTSGPELAEAQGEGVSQRYVASCGLLDLVLTAEILSVVLNCPTVRDLDGRSRIQRSACLGTIRELG